MTVEVIGHSALGRPLYGVVFNPLETAPDPRLPALAQYSGLALTNPDRAQGLLERWGGDVKVPVFVNGAIHGNEYEGVESNMQLIEQLATLPTAPTRGSTRSSTTSSWSST